MTIAEYKNRVKSDYESPAWILLEKIANCMTEKGIFIDSINGTGLVKDQHDGKQVSIEIVYRHNGTSKDVSARIKVYEFNKGYIEYYKTKVQEGASEKVICKRVDKVVEALK